MPFVTVVTLGAAASDFISTVVKPHEGKSTLTAIRAVGENELYNDYPFVNTMKVSHAPSPLDCQGEDSLKGSRRKSVSFVDLSSVGVKLSLTPASESGYSSSGSGSGSGSGASSVTNSCNSSSSGSSVSGCSVIGVGRNVLNQNDSVFDAPPVTGNGNVTSSDSKISSSIGFGGTIQGKTTLWKTWIRNKLNLSKNGKYSFEGSLVSLGHFGIKANKSLLVDCTSDTEFSSRKFYNLKRIPNISNGFENSSDSDIVEDLDDNCNLFVKECLKTYSLPFLELVDDCPDLHEKLHESIRNANDTDVVDSSQVPIVVRNSHASYKAPPWFWVVWTQSRGIQLDEAGIALEGRVVVIYNEEQLGEKFVQVKWDELDEKFYLIVWTGSAGCDYVCKIDLGEADPVWHNEQKLTLDESLVLQSEQRRSFLRDLYTVCAELGCYERSASLASPENVDRVKHVVQLFQRVAALGLIKNGRSWTKVRIKVDASLEKSKSDRKTTGAIHSTSSPMLFTVHVDSVEFRLRSESGAPIEPYFLSVSLYDVKNGRKISEDFHTTVDISGSLVGNSKALFRVSEANDQIFVVVRVEKTLQATDVETYLRGNPDGKTGSRISKSITTSPLFTDGQRYRMPLCWSVCCLFKKSSGFTSDGTGYIIDPDASFSPFYKHEKSTEDELLKILADIKKPEKVSKLTPVPGVLKVSLQALKPDQLALTETKENCSPSSIIEFPIQSSENFSRFAHLLYVYPINLNLNSLTGKIRARNILCRVFLRAEDDTDASPLEQNPVSGSIATYVLHHRSSPEWYSEIKLSLPVALDPRLHLLFQFFHISCSFDNKANKSKQVENLVGYAWIPLLNKYRFIGGEHVLPVAATLPSGYLQIQPLGLGKGSQSEDDVAVDRSVGGGSIPHLLQITRITRKRSSIMQQYSGPDIAWLDKCTLTVKLNLVSTVWTKSGCLGAFFAHAEKYLQKGICAARFHCDDENTVKIIRSLESMDLPTLRDFFPTIMNQICTVSTISKVVGNATLKFMIFAFHALIEAGLESVIEQYVRMRFLSPLAEDKPKKTKENTMADVLIDAWIDLFETGDGATIATSLEQSRYLFSMIVKSIGVQGFKFENLEECPLVKMTQLFSSEVVQRCQPDHALARGANDNLVSFISALLSVVTVRQVVFSAINAYLACFGPGDSHKVQDFKFVLLQSLVEHPLFLELNAAEGDEEQTRLDNITWAKRHFLVATVMKQSRSGLGEVSNVRSLALKPIMSGLTLHERSGLQSPMWTPWLRVVCDNLHRIPSISSGASHSSRCSSVSTVLSATSSTLVHAALSKSISNQNHEGHNHGIGHNRDSCRTSVHSHQSHQGHLHGLGNESSRSSTLSLNVPNGINSCSQNSSMMSINNIGTGTNGSIGGGSGGSGDRMSIDRLSIGSMSNCDYLDAISAIKTSNPAASVAKSTTSCGSGTETIVNENISNENGSGDGQSLQSIKEPSDEGDDDGLSVKPSQMGTNTEADKSNVVLRRYDKLNDVETSQLLVSGLYLLKTMGKDGLRVFWNKSNNQERASLLQMIHLACAHFTNAKKNSTITRKKVVGIVVPPTMPPSPRTSLLPNKKWSSLPSKTTDGEVEDGLKNSPRKGSTAAPLEAVNDWKSLSTESTFVCVDTLSNLCNACKGENNEMRDVIRTTLDVAKASEDTRAMLGALENLYKVEELASIVFAKGNEDLSHQLFCDLLSGFGTSYLINTCVLILGKLFLHSPSRTTSQSLLAVSTLVLTPAFVHNFRKALEFLESNMSVNDRSSFVLSITEKLSFIDVNEFAPNGGGKERDSCRTLLSVENSGGRHNGRMPRKFANKLERKLSTTASDLPNRLSTVINSLWLLKSCHNDYRISELYLKLANAYSHFAMARLRIDAFDALREEHLTRKRYSEALICEIHVAARLARQSATPEVRKIMLGISRNLHEEFEELEEPPEEEDTTEELIQRLETCVHLCEKAERYELMIEVYSILVDIQESLCDYASLEHSYKQMSRACALIQNKRERFLATYYRVALFYPKKHSSSRPTEVYVYKEPNVTSLMEICGKVEAAESAVIISGEVDHLPDDDNIYATITHVTPIPSESPRRKLWSEDFRRHQNVQKFTYDTPFAVKSHDKISIDNKAAVHQQWKRRTTITTEYTFPAVVSRLRVTHSEEEDLSPIVVAIDDMQRRVTELRSELQSMDIKRIQLRLQGSVSVQVNQGPLAYARAFLDKENEFPAQDMHRLKAIFRDFVECCGELLIRNGHLITPDQADYQTQLESDYTRLCQVLSPVLGLPEVALNRMSRISISSY